MKQPTRDIPGDTLTSGMTLVGDSGGVVAILDVNASSAMPGMLTVETEFGALYLDPDVDHTIEAELLDALLVIFCGDCIDEEVHLVDGVWKHVKTGDVKCYEEEDPDVASPGVAQFKCPHCGETDTIVERDSALRWNTVVDEGITVADDGSVESVHWSTQGDETFEGDGYGCSACLVLVSVEASDHNYD